jgi:hypothetical protein
VLGHQDRFGAVPGQSRDNAPPDRIVPNFGKWPYWDISPELIGDSGKDAWDWLIHSREGTGVVGMSMHHTSNLRHVLIDVRVSCGITGWSKISINDISVKIAVNHGFSCELRIHQATWLNQEAAFDALGHVPSRPDHKSSIK